MTNPMSDAASLRRKAERISAEARKMLDGIPPGQPVMSRRHRNLLDRHRAKMRAAGELYALADQLAAGQSDG